MVEQMKTMSINSLGERINYDVSLEYTHLENTKVCAGLLNEISIQKHLLLIAS